MDKVNILFVKETLGDQAKESFFSPEENSFSHQITYAENIEDACHLLTSEEPDVILIDAQLIFSTKDVKNIIKAATIKPVIVLSPIENEDLATRCLREGVQDFLEPSVFKNPLLFRKALIYAKERKQAEKELQIRNENLENSNWELKSFTSAASHDLQEPLRKVRAFCDILDRRFSSNIPEEAQDYFDRIKNAAARMQRLIQDLLTLSKITNQNKPLTCVDLNDVVQGVLGDLEIRLRETEGTVEVGDLPHIDADLVQMRQLFQNLIGNALKFHEKGQKAKVEIFCRRIEDVKENSETLNNFCEIVVQDHGIGFDEKYRSRIFIAFERLHSRGKYEGTGVGLAICRKIIERHNGKIEVESKPGEGARFIVYLPVKHTRTS